MATRDVDTLVQALTLEEKVLLLSGVDMWHVPSISRLGIGSIKVNDTCKNFQTLRTPDFEQIAETKYRQLMDHRAHAASSPSMGPKLRLSPDRYVKGRHGHELKSTS